MNYKLLFSLFLLSIFLFFMWYRKQEVVSVLLSSKKIDSLQIRFGYDSVQTIVIKDEQELYKIDKALRSMKETNKFYGGYSDTGATFILHKGAKDVNFRISHSPYYGWILGIGTYDGKYENPYLFNIVKNLPASQ